MLIIDAVDTYGTDFASFTPAALQDVIQSQQQHAAQPGEVGEAGSNTSQHPAPASRQLQQPEHEHSMPDALVAPAPLPPGCRLLRLRQRPLPVTGGVRAMAVPGEEGGGPADRRSYILDLVPKVRGLGCGGGGRLWRAEERTGREWPARCGGQGSG